MSTKVENGEEVKMEEVVSPCSPRDSQESSPTSQFETAKET